MLLNRRIRAEVKRRVRYLFVMEEGRSATILCPGLGVRGEWQYRGLRVLGGQDWGGVR